MRQLHMVLFLDSDRYQFLTSRDLLHGTPSQIIAVPGSAECPDFFRIRLEGSERWKWVFWACTDNYLVGHMEGAFGFRSFAFAST